MATPGNRLANLTQLVIGGTFRTANSSFPILLPEEIRGSIRHVDDYNELLSIDSIFLEPGQLAYVRNAIVDYPSGYYFLEDISPTLQAVRQPNGSLINYKWSRFGLSNSSIVKIVDFEDSQTITVAHNFGYNPNVIITESNGDEIEGQIVHLDVNTIQVTLNVPKTGKLTIK